VTWPIRRRIVDQLLYPGCGDVIASATYTRWQGDLVLVSPEGHLIQPVGGAVETRRTQQKPAAALPADRVEAQDRVDFLRAVSTN
jgi:hypothetical protein